ncbi:MAG TPA: M57 family metalloprotease, partial [Flavobacterium sp.]|nr:M57 family metalloprotease [Flavobacterium sp.]
PWLSPYSVVNSNPILYKDVNGKDWEITITYDKSGNKTIHVKLTAAVLDATTGQKIDMNAFKASVEAQIKSTYGISYSEASKYSTIKLAGKDVIVPTESRNVTVVLDLNIRIIKGISNLKKDEHLIKIVDNNSSELDASETAKVNKIGGKVINIKEKYVADIIANVNKKTVAHEIGHTLGLRHIDKPAETVGEHFDRFFGGEGNDQYRGPASNNPDNVMLSNYKPSANKLNPEQMQIIEKRYKNGKINKR